MKYGTCDGLQFGEYVSGRGGILTTHQSSTKLTTWTKQIYVIGPNKGLGHPDDSLSKRHLTMVIGRMLRHVTSQLSNLDFVFKVPLEA